MAFSLRTKSEIPVAVVEGGSKNGKVLYLHDDEDIPYGEQELEVNDGIFSIYPETRVNQTDSIIICALKGAGKSTFINNYVKRFHEIYPLSKKTLVFTTQEPGIDPSLEEMRSRMNYIKIDETLLKEPIEIGDLNKPNEKGEYLPRLIIFDDYVGSRAKVDKEIKRLRNAISCNGRKLGLFEIVAQTDIPLQTDKGFKELLDNCSKFITFGRKMPSNISGMLERQFGMPKDIKKEYKKFPSMWWIISKSETPYMLLEHHAIIFDADAEEERLEEERVIKRELLRAKIEDIREKLYDD